MSLLYCSMTMAGRRRISAAFMFMHEFQHENATRKNRDAHKSNWPKSSSYTSSSRSSTQSWPTDWAVAYLGEIAQCLNVHELHSQSQSQSPVRATAPTQAAVFELLPFGLSFEFRACSFLSGQPGQLFWRQIFFWPKIEKEISICLCCCHLVVL